MESVKELQKKLPKKQWTHVIFDMDGLLFDTERIYRESWEALAPVFGQIPNPKVPEAVCGVSGSLLKKIILDYYPAIDADAYIDACTQRVRDVLSHHVPMKPGVRQMLDYLKKNHVKTAIASSSPRAIIIRNLSLTGLTDDFDAIVSGEEVRHGKPAPDIFLAAAAMLNAAPADCLVFEDGLHGIEAASAAGCLPVMIPDLTPPTDAIRPLCTAIYPDLNAAANAMQSGEL